MKKEDYLDITYALNLLERHGFDVTAIWRAFGERSAAEQKLLDTPAPLETLDLTVEAYLKGAKRPLVLLRQRELALKSEVERLSLVLDRLEQRGLSVTLGRDDRKQIESAMKLTKHQLSRRNRALHALEFVSRNKRHMDKLSKAKPSK